MHEFFASGRAADAVLCVLAVEAIWLIARGNSWRDVVPALLPAVLMIVAVRAALTGAPWPWVSIPLALAFPVHIYDLYRRGMLSRKNASSASTPSDHGEK